MGLSRSYYVILQIHYACDWPSEVKSVENPDLVLIVKAVVQVGCLGVGRSDEKVLGERPHRVVQELEGMFEMNFGLGYGRWLGSKLNETRLDDESLRKHQRSPGCCQWVFAAKGLMCGDQFELGSLAMSDDPMPTLRYVENSVTDCVIVLWVIPTGACHDSDRKKHVV